MSFFGGMFIIVGFFLALLGWLPLLNDEPKLALRVFLIAIACSTTGIFLTEVGS